MLRIGFVALVTALFSVPNGIQADDANPKEIVEQGIKALGGEEKLTKAAAFQWKVDGKIKFGDNDNPFSGASTIQGIDSLRSEFESEFNGNKFKASTVVAGEKGWRRFNEMTVEIDKEGLANEKRQIYLQIVPATLLPLKTKDFQVAMGKTERVAGKEATGLKVTGPDGKEFQLYFDKESHLPVRQVADVRGFMGEEFTQETTFEKYKAFEGIQKATHIENKRDGQAFLVLDVTEFKVLPKVEPETFAEPK